MPRLEIGADSITQERVDREFVHVLDAPFGELTQEGMTAPRYKHISDPEFRVATVTGTRRKNLCEQPRWLSSKSCIRRLVIANDHAETGKLTMSKIQGSRHCRNPRRVRIDRICSLPEAFTLRPMSSKRRAVHRRGNSYSRLRSSRFENDGSQLTILEMIRADYLPRELSYGAAARPPSLV
jgi:hypothetical protein